MTFAEKMKQTLDKGIEASKDLLGKAGQQAQSWGEQGMLKIEIMQLRSQARTLTGKLGAEVYEYFSDKGFESVTKDLPEIAPLIKRIEDLEEVIEQKENLFRKAGGTDKDLDGDGKPD